MGIRKHGNSPQTLRKSQSELFVNQMRAFWLNTLQGLLTGLHLSLPLLFLS